MCFRFLEHVAVVRPMSMSAVVDAVQLAVCSAEPARLRALQPITHRSYSDICPKYCDSLPSSSLSLPFLIPSLPSFPSPHSSSSSSSSRSRRGPSRRCAFPVTAARAWNALPSPVRSAPSLLQFRRDLNTALFQSSYSSP